MLIETMPQMMRVKTRSSCGNSDSRLEKEISRNTPRTDRRRSKKRSETGPPGSEPGTAPVRTLLVISCLHERHIGNVMQFTE